MIWRARRRRFTAFPESRGYHRFEVSEQLLLPTVRFYWPGSEFEPIAGDHHHHRFYIGAPALENIVAEALLTGDTWELRIQPNIVP